MGALKRGFRAAAVGAIAVSVAPPATAIVPEAPATRLEVVPGGLVRWSAPATKRCGMSGRSWPALQETCYYPIDLLHKPGLVKISRSGVGPTKFAQIAVIASSYSTRDIKLGDIPQAHPSPADLRRNARDQAVVAKIWARREGPAQFALPLGPPAAPLPEALDFGAKWEWGDDLGSPDVHSGVDYPLPVGSPVGAAADGTIVVAEDLFYTGNAVFIDHGDGLISMYFHFAELKVKPGQEVKKGDVLGLVGSTGRATGPHLHLGIRWHGARINPKFLLEDPAKIPAVSP
jgi:hypothetical protein